MDSTPIDSQLHTSTSEQYSGQRQTPWTEDTVDILLRAVRDAFPRLDGKLEKRDRVWRDIFAVVSPQPHHVDLLTLVVPGATMQQCKVKWKNLRYAFMRYIENMKTTGARKLHVPQGYDLLCSFLGERPITHPRTERCGLENEQLRDALVTGTTTIKTVTPVAGASGVSRIVTPVAGPSGVSRADTPVAGPSGVSRIVTPVAGPSGVSRADTPVAGPSGVSRIVTPVAGPSGVSRADTPVAGPSGVSRATTPASMSDPDDPPPLLNIPEVRQSVKRKKIRPPSQSKRFELMQKESLEQVKASRSKMENFLAIQEEWIKKKEEAMEKNRMFQEEVLKNKKLLEIEEKKLEVLKELLELQRNRKK
ncbi:uncharacterized protein LOC123508825 [Portunus trituberculatus]|uniref:uncharacterized protein LOC123508825 n=1 Tax=Portunus trituberculatus TaxID=210409 RepID=UPI001E1D1A43|nr:uncharacterized protein LOC123508825 [Portunus trituberculatus]